MHALSTALARPAPAPARPSASRTSNTVSVPISTSSWVTYALRPNASWLLCPFTRMSPVCLAVLASLPASVSAQRQAEGVGVSKRMWRGQRQAWWTGLRLPSHAAHPGASSCRSRWAP